MMGLSKRSALFLDRDGVIIKDVGYLHQSKDKEFLPIYALLRGGEDRSIPL